MSRDGSISWTTPFPEERDVRLEFKWKAGSPAHMGSLTYPGDPGDPPEIESLEAFDCKSGEPVKLTDEQSEKAEGFIFSTFDFDDFDDDYER